MNGLDAMQHNPMARTAWLGLFLFAAPAAAQSTAILGRHDADFARELYEHGWTDLAEGVVRAYEKLDRENKADPLDLLEVQAVGLDVRLDLARRDPDVDRRQQGIAAVIAAKEKLVEEHPRTKVGRDTRDNLPDAYRLLGEALTSALAKETDPARISTLRSEGEAAFERAESDLKQRMEALSEARIEETPAGVAADVQYMNALFNLGRTYYFHSRFYPSGDSKREQLLSSAVGTFEDFGLDFAERLLNFEAIYYIGLCHKAQGKNDKALSDWEYIVDLRRSFEADAEGRHELTPVVADLVSRSSLQRVLLFSELGRTDEAIAAADDFWTKTADPEFAASGLAVLAAKAEAQLSANDAAAAGETARRLIDLDPQGPWGNKGREVLGKMIGSSANISPGEILRVAQNLNAQGRAEATLDAVQHALLAARGDAKEQDYGSQALFLMGQVYRQKGWIHEASLVFDTAFERYPRGDAAPDALAQAIDCYVKLNAKEKRPFYKTRVQERGQSLAQKFPNHPALALISQSEARVLKEEGKYLEAAQLFRVVPAGSTGYAEAQVQAGSCLYMHGRALAKEQKTDQAKAQFTEVESLLVKALAEVASAKTKSLDPQVLGRLSSAEYAGLTNLANLYLEDLVGKPALALKTLEGADERFATDARAIEAIWQQRIRALEKLGRIDEAVMSFDERLKQQSDHSGLAGAAGVLARSLDQRAVDQAAAAAKSEPADAALVKQAQELWRKSVRYYKISVETQLENRASARAADLEAVAKRLLEVGESINGVPEEAHGFVGWHEARAAEPNAWEAAAEVYDVAVELEPANYRSRIGHSRSLAYLRRWREAADAFASLFEGEALVKADKSGFDPQVVQSKPELVEAYLEWGVCEAEAGLAEKSTGAQTQALTIFELLVTNTTPGSRLWWNGKYRQTRTLFERGMYEPADVTLRTVERSTSKDFADAPAALRPHLLELRAEVSKKIKR